MLRLEKYLTPLLRKAWPNFDSAEMEERMLAVVVSATALFMLPFVIAGLVWLVLVTDLGVIRRNWIELLVLGVIIIFFKRFRFHMTVEVAPGLYSTAYTSTSIAIWSGLLVFGPVVLWFNLVGDLLDMVLEWRLSESDRRWEQMRNFLVTTASALLPALIALALYEQWGGVFPMAGMSRRVLTLGFSIMVIELMLALVVLMPMPLAYVHIIRKVFKINVSPFSLFIRSFMLIGANFLLDPLAVPVAGLYAHSGVGVYFFVLGLMLGVAFIGTRLSNTSEANRQRTRELQQLDRLSHALLNAPLDGSQLSEILRQHVKGMFARTRIEIRIFPDELLFCDPEDDHGPGEAAWAWLQEHSGEWIFRVGEMVPWRGLPTNREEMFLAIGDEGDECCRGGIYIAQRREFANLDDIVPALQSLGAQIASALKRADVYRATLIHQRAMQELAVAGKIQASFLPDDLPIINGWQFATALEPARETSGDFFDLIPMWDGKIGVIVADVADKGIGAALYMALSRTLLRTYAVEYSTRHPDNYAFHPERVLTTVNQCILRDTRSDLFVTVFYGIIDPEMGLLTYANAGHNPPFLIGVNGDKIEARALKRTGLPLGMFDDRNWERGSIDFRPGEMLVMYTDGVTEAEDGDENFFEEQRLLRIVTASMDHSAQTVVETTVNEVRSFMGAMPQGDDITLLIVKREPIILAGD